jgi:hypothetical protein
LKLQGAAIADFVLNMINNRITGMNPGMLETLQNKRAAKTIKVINTGEQIVLSRHTIKKGSG